MNYRVNAPDASICICRHRLSHLARLTPRQFLDIVGILVLGIASARIGRLYECCGRFPDFRTYSLSKSKDSSLRSSICWPTWHFRQVEGHRSQV